MSVTYWQTELYVIAFRKADSHVRQLVAVIRRLVLTKINTL